MASSRHAGSHARDDWAEPYIYHAEMIAEYMQIFSRYCIGAPAGGATTLAMVHHAASAIATRMCNTVLIATGDSLVSGLSRDQAIEAMPTAGHPQFERPYGPPDSRERSSGTQAQTQKVG